MNSLQTLHPINNTYTNSRTISNNRPGVNVSFDKLITTGNNSINSVINSSFNSSFDNNDASEFIKLVNNKLPDLYHKNITQPITTSLKANYLMYGLPVSGSIGDNSTQVTIDKSGRLQITDSSIGNLMVNHNDLKNDEWQQTFWEKNVYNYAPGLKDIPVPSFIPTPGRSSVSNKEIISGGVRFLDPWPQSEWEKTSLGKNWPPDPYTTKGPLRLSADKNKQAILMDTNHPSCINVGKTYGVAPRGIITVNPEDSSVILAVQQSNINSNPSIKLAPWIIAPIKVPEGKRSLAAIPVHNESTVQPETKANNISDWLKVIETNNQWKLDKQNEFIILDPLKHGQQSKLNTQNTNWALYAIEESDKVIVMRSLYKHPDQFQAFVRSSNETKNAEYLELEYTGPKVPPGYNSTVVVKWDFVPISMLSNNQFSKFGESGNFENEVLTVSKSLGNLIDQVTRN